MLLHHYSHIGIIWLSIGFFGQFLFSMRFIIQWLVSEYQKRSIIPTAFWYFSIAGGITLFAYAIYKRDPVFILGQGMGLVIYCRNLYFVRQYQQKEPMIKSPL